MKVFCLFPLFLVGANLNPSSANSGIFCNDNAFCQTTANIPSCKDPAFAACNIETNQCVFLGNRPNGTVCSASCPGGTQATCTNGVCQCPNTNTCKTANDCKVPPQCKIAGNAACVFGPAGPSQNPLGVCSYPNGPDDVPCRNSNLPCTTVCRNGACQCKDTCSSAANCVAPPSCTTASGALCLAGSPGTCLYRAVANGGGCNRPGCDLGICQNGFCECNGSLPIGSACIADISCNGSTCSRRQSVKCRASKCQCVNQCALGFLCLGLGGGK